jgi:DNA repair exonuclease SbcCD ATPase subunit
MHINFNKIIIDNFMSFGHAEFSFNNLGYVLIKGINNNIRDNALSNGSGKSTLFNALCYALTGETIQGVSSNLNNLFTQDDMSVSLDFLVDKMNFNITRSKTLSGKSDLKISVDGVDKSGKGIRESEAILKQYLPELTSDLIGEIILIGQGMPHKFSSNTPSGRKELLEKLSNSDFMIIDLKSKVEAREQILKNNLQNLNNKNIKLETELNLYNDQLANKKLELSKYDKRPDFNKDIEQKAIEIKQVEDQLNQLNIDITKCSETLESLYEDKNKLDNNRQKEIDQEENEFSKANSLINKELTENLSSLKALKVEIQKLSSITDVCPTCGQKLHNVEKPDISKHLLRQSELEAVVEDLTTKDNKQKEALRLNKEIIINQYNDNVKTINEQINTLKVKNTHFNTEKENLLTRLNSVKLEHLKLVSEADSFDQNKLNLENQVKDIESKQIQLNSDLLYNNKEIADLNEHLSSINKMITALKRDFRGILLTNIITYIDKKCKEYCYEIFNNSDIEFKLDGNNININYQNKSLENLSGGEQQKVDLIVQFAIRSMMQECSGFTSNILVLDEILDNLDSVGSDAVLNFISNRLTDVENIFIISHHADTLNINTDSTITIVKNEKGVSSIYEI